MLCSPLWMHLRSQYPWTQTDFSIKAHIEWKSHFVSKLGFWPFLFVLSTAGTNPKTLLWPTRWPTLRTSMKFLTCPALRCCRTTSSALKTYFALQTQSLALGPALLSTSAQVYSVSESPGRRDSGYWNHIDRDVPVFPRCRRLGVRLQHRSCPRRAADLGRVRPWSYRSGLSNSQCDCLETAAEQGQASLQGKALSFPGIFSHSLYKTSQKKDLNY